MGPHRDESMRRYWDERATENAVFYVDTSSDYDQPNITQFLETGRRVARQALDGAGSALVGHGLAVEIGPGLGRVCLAMAEHFDRVIGVDVSPEMVRRARELVADPRVSFELGDGHTLDAVASASADFVYEFTVFQHIPKVSIIEGYVAEAARVLRPGGVAALQWNNQGSSLGWKIRAWVRIAGRRLGVRRWADPRFSRAFLGSAVSTDRLFAALGASGFEVVNTDGLGTLFAWVWARKADPAG